GGGAAGRATGGVKAPSGMLGFGLAFGGAVAAGLFLWRGPYRLPIGRRGGDMVASIGRWGLHAAVAVAVLFALFMSQLFIPGLASRLSSRDVLAAYRDLRRDGDQLAML